MLGELNREVLHPRDAKEPEGSVGRYIGVVRVAPVLFL